MIKFNTYYNGVINNYGVINQYKTLSNDRVLSIIKPSISYKIINNIVYLTIDKITYILSIEEFNRFNLPKTTFTTTA